MHAHVRVVRARLGPTPRSPRSRQQNAHKLHSCTDTPVHTTRTTRHGPDAPSTPDARPYMRPTRQARRHGCCRPTSPCSSSTSRLRCRATPPPRWPLSHTAADAATAALRPVERHSLPTFPDRRSLHAARHLRIRRKLTARRLRVHHDGRSAAHLLRPTHSPELHRAAADERRHRRHASDKGEPRLR